MKPKQMTEKILCLAREMDILINKLYSVDEAEGERCINLLQEALPR